jgi:type I restriction enzyme S subunit
VKVRLDPTRAIPEFYYYWFCSPVGQHSLLSNVSTVGVPGLVQPVATVKALRVPVPSIAEQEAIVSVLAALDDAIAANRIVVERADQLSAAQWSATTFGGSAQLLSDLAEFVNGKAFTKGATGKGRVVLRIAELNSGIGRSTVYSDIEVPEQHLARPGDLLFAWSGSLTVARWFRPEAIVNQHIFKVIPRSPYPMWLVNQAVRAKLESYRAVASDKATTMGHIQRKHLDELVEVPSIDEIERLDGIMGGLWSTALAAEVEMLALERTRDTLLPLLTSGKLTVKAAESLVEGVV